MNTVNMNGKKSNTTKGKNRSSFKESCLMYKYLYISYKTSNTFKFAISNIKIKW